MNTPPLFVPLKGIHYDAFANGKKTFELRRYGRQWTEKNIYFGRNVTISYGYGKQCRLHGFIDGPFVFDNVELAFKKHHWSRILPFAGSLEKALDQAYKFVGHGKVITFDPMIESVSDGDCPRCRKVASGHEYKCNNCNAPLKVLGISYSRILEGDVPVFEIDRSGDSNV